MTSLFYNISQVLGIAILHSLWQGLLIWFLLRVVFSASPGISAVKKYNMAAVAMLGIAALVYGNPV
jgi:bla regulator protein BlaR1